MSKAEQNVQTENSEKVTVAAAENTAKEAKSELSAEAVKSMSMVQEAAKAASSSATKNDLPNVEIKNGEKHHMQRQNQVPMNNKMREHSHMLQETSPMGGGKRSSDSLNKIIKPGNNSSEQAKNSDASSIGQLKESLKEVLEKEPGLSLSDLLKRKEGVEKLATGDYLVKEDDRQTLFTPNGDKITVNNDGTYSLKGNVRKVSSDEEGRTTVEFKDGGVVSFDKEGILSVDRGSVGVSFGRFGHGSKVPWGMPGKPFDPSFEKPGHGDWGKPGPSKPGPGKPMNPGVPFFDKKSGGKMNESYIEEKKSN